MGTVIKKERVVEIIFKKISLRISMSDKVMPIIPTISSKFQAGGNLCNILASRELRGYSYPHFPK